MGNAIDKCEPFVGCPYSDNQSRSFEVLVHTGTCFVLTMVPDVTPPCCSKPLCSFCCCCCVVVSEKFLGFSSEAHFNIVY